jgi:hypothetical protein
VRLGEHVDRRRQAGFVGRRPELHAFEAALAGQAAPRVFLVHGPGGIGKTTLLLEMRARAQAAGRTVAMLDGNEIDPSPDGFTRAAATDADVLMIDAYDQLAALDDWVRREYVVTRSADAIVVLAGRDRPAAAWRTDAGWRAVSAPQELGPLDDADSTELLTRAGVPDAACERLVNLGRGHPLALALLADVAGTTTPPRALADVPELITTLVESVVREAPTEAHMAGLATCAIAWLTTEDLLRATVGGDAPSVWAWLLRRPFIVSRPGGLTPHDLTREVLEAEFERRAPERYRRIHRIIHDQMVTGVRAGGGSALGQQLLFLHRRSPLSTTFFQLRAQGSAALVPATVDDYPQILAMIEHDEGPASAAFANRWLAIQPEQVGVVRGPDGVAGFAVHLIVPSQSTMDSEDPVVRACLQHAAPRPGEQISIIRFMSGAKQGQRDPYAALAASTSAAVEWCTRRLAVSYNTPSDTEYWGPFFDYLGFQPVLEVTVGRTRCVGYAQDWRRFPVDAWLDLMREREHAGGSGPPPESALRPPPLDQEAFAVAVRAALEQFTRPERLAGNPLGPGVRELIEGAIERLPDEPKGEHARAVLRRTFIRPAASREAAAEALDLPFSTYRRHLAKAVDQLIEQLWSAEIYGSSAVE